MSFHDALLSRAASWLALPSLSQSPHTDQNRPKPTHLLRKVKSNARDLGRLKTFNFRSASIYNDVDLGGFPSLLLLQLPRPTMSIARSDSSSVFTRDARYIQLIP